MEQLTTRLEENQQALDALLGVGRNYDVISRDLYIGQWKGRLYVIDGYGDDGVIERITSFLLGRGAQLGKGAKNMQEFIDRCVTFCEVDCENNLAEGDAAVNKLLRHLLRGGLREQPEQHPHRRVSGQDHPAAGGL